MFSETSIPVFNLMGFEEGGPFDSYVGVEIVFIL